MNETSFLDGKVWRRSLPLVQPGSAAAAAPLKRLLLPQGELAQFHDAELAIHYMAFIELRAGTVRGNHVHKAKQEFIYVLRGAFRLVVQEPVSGLRAEINVQAGDEIFIEPGIAHALEVVESGEAIEFSPQRFEAIDIQRVTLL